MMRFSRRVQTVNAFRGYIHSRIKPKSKIRPGQGIIDGLWNSHRLYNAFFMQGQGDLNGFFSTNDDQGIHAAPGIIILDLLDLLFVIQRIDTAGAKDGPAFIQDACGGFDIEDTHIILNQTKPAVLDTGDHITFLHALTDNSPNDRI